MSKSHAMTLCAVAAVLAAAIGCSKDDSKGKKGLPPAQDWQAPAAKATQNPPAGDPHAGMSNPHAGMSDPHAGMSDPHAGMSNPHAGMSNPHAGMADPHADVAGAPQGGSSGVDVAALGLEGPDPERPIDPNKFLSGTLKPTAKTRSSIAPGAVIFLSVKRADPKTGKPTGAPLAVKKLVASGWPQWFRITEEDAMIRGTEFSGDVVITAWTDRDHDAISKQPGDVQGQITATIPQKKITLLLDTVL